jgi:hypothetical protein
MHSRRNSRLRTCKRKVPEESTSGELARGRSGCLATLEAFPAKHRTPLGGPERNSGLTPALGADGRCFNPSRWHASFRRIVLALCLARSAPLRLVPEVLLVIKLLFARGKDKVSTAIRTNQNPIVKVRHGTILRGVAKRLPFASPAVLLSAVAQTRATDLWPVRACARLSNRGQRTFVGRSFNFPPTLLPVPFTRQGLLDPQLLARLQIERMPLDLFDDVFLLHLAFEAPEGIFQGFTVLESYFSQNLKHLQTDHGLT